VHHNSTPLFRFCLWKNLPSLPSLFILPNFSPTSSNIHPQTFYYPIQIKFLLYTFLVIYFSWTPLLLDSTVSLSPSSFLCLSFLYLLYIFLPNFLLKLLYCCSNYSPEWHLWYADFSKALSWLSSSGDYKKTRQGALTALLPYLYKLQVVHATTMCLSHIYSTVTVQDCASCPNIHVSYM